MGLFVIGINHTTAPVKLREQVAFSAETLPPALASLHRLKDLSAAMILSTCNRTEIYALHTDSKTRSTEEGSASQAARDAVVMWLAEHHDTEVAELPSSLYWHEDGEAIHHLVRVSAGLDSMVLGEAQIFGQVKDAFEAAETARTLDRELSQIQQSVYRVVKKVRSETDVGQSSLSMASIAVDLAGRLFADLSLCRVMLIGAGETIELVGQHLMATGINSPIIANRTLANARRLSDELDGTAISLPEIPQYLSQCDIVVSSTGSELPILGKGSVESALRERRRKPIFMVDLAVPRDIEPEVDTLRDVYLYSIDDLEQIAAENLHQRKGAAEEAEQIIDAAVSDIQNALRERGASETITKFRQHHNDIKNGELEKALARLQKGDEPESVLTTLANQLMNKMIHAPSVSMKQASSEGQQELLDIIHRLYDLDR